MIKYLKESNVNFMKWKQWSMKKQNLFVQIFKFGVVGGIATIIDMILLFIFKEKFHLPLEISNTLSFSISLIYNYIASTKWVFSVKEKKSKKKFYLFILLSIIGLIINNFIIVVLSKHIEMFYMWAKVVATIVVMIFNFITRKKFLENDTFCDKKYLKVVKIKCITLFQRIKESYYFGQLKAHVNVILFCVVLAIICVMITYPGVFYSDSYSRINSAIITEKNIKAFIKHGTVFPKTNSWLTPVPSILMAISNLFVHNISFYTFLQAFLYFFVTYLLIKKISKQYKILTVLLLLNPLILCTSIYHEAGIGCIIGICVIILLLTNDSSQKNNIDKVIEFFSLILFSFITFGFRANAFTILPVLIGYVLLRKKQRILKIISILSLIIGLLFTNLVPKFLNISVLSSKSVGFVWEILNAINELPSDKKTEYMAYFDDIGGVGVTQKAIEKNTDPRSVNGFLSDQDVKNFLQNQENSKIIIQKYIELAIHEPMTYIKNKWHFTKLNLGIGTPLTMVEYDYNRWNRMKNFNFNDTNQRHKFVNAYINFNNRFYWFTRVPILTFSISLLLTAYQFLCKKKNRKMILFIYLIAVFYYGAFLINTQSFEIRYFFPSLYLMFVMDCVIIMEIFCDLKNNIMKKRGKK